MARTFRRHSPFPTRWPVRLQGKGRPAYDQRRWAENDDAVDLFTDFYPDFYPDAGDEDNQSSVYDREWAQLEQWEAQVARIGERQTRRLEQARSFAVHQRQLRENRSRYRLAYPWYEDESEYTNDLPF